MIGLLMLNVGAAVSLAIAVASVMPRESARKIVLPIPTPVTLIGDFLIQGRSSGLPQIGS
jgi:hypothetical protein